MGVVRRQGIKQSIVTYLGIFIGALSTFFLYNRVEVEDAYGYIQFINSAAMLAVPFVMFGTANVMIRFFPEFKEDTRGHHGILSTLSLTIFLGFILFTVFIFFTKNWIYQYYEDKPETYLNYLPYAIPLVFLISYSNLLQRYIFNFQRIVVPAIYNYLLPKIILPALMLGVLYAVVDVQTALSVLVVMWLVINLGQLLYIRQLGQLYFNFNFNFLTRERLKRMFNFGIYGLLGGWGFVLTSRIDLFMVGFILVDPKLVTVYAICSFVAEFIDVPRKAIINITSPLISKAWAENDLEYLKKMYRSTSITQYIVGLGLFLLIWLSIEDVFSIMSNSAPYIAAKYVVLFLGMSKVVDMVTGVNNSIIGLSEYYRFNLILTLILALINILNNWYLIPIYGLEGAAIATLISIILFNLGKFLFLLIKFKMQPFSWNTLWVTLIGIFSYFILFKLSLTEFLLINLVVRSVLFITIFTPLIYYFKVSKEINDAIEDNLGKILNLINIKK